MNSLNAQQAKEMILAVADKIIDSKQLLTEIDGKIGDGDHGVGMAGGLSKVKEKLQTMQETENVYDIFALSGKTMMMSMGGASGVIFGSMFMAGAKSQQTAEMTPKDFAAMMSRSLDTIKERGKAQLGDKTMVDALEPAVEAMERHLQGGFEEMLEAARVASAKGVENTKQYQAKHGRAKSLMERAIGFQDAGATSVWLIFSAMYDYACGH